ncbi:MULTISPECIES: sulfatase [unclassified Lentimonas]|uniref:sulfatase n=1 Tax=unclassified Lentimonas TaxID=2630993 RepID=UPI001324A0BB|nr:MULTISPECIES: sulfatase [unclassified Lentimonas]CAA6677863.1 N-acetylgalactosamine-6-sulfatase [Lentimonas sp. CC4]CAA6683967.1 N-acetylgalactosamine-6-sulfatase [Lentimonas sp. CC6]CAA7076657.1 N-acetylgalactosamine-6-sulfatase [Lentimonas sp. CC4]CAA7170015.1 N-acetylgalactosamine-6-sulfatase [Lentimonas sp. CC21]CAA7181298.1 N-acetylgalactosamine-6-sulfatase [Lentimonas sp. CC8]
MNFLATSLFAFAALVMSASAAKKPNIIVFLVDDMGVMDTSVPFLTDDAGDPVVYPLNEWYRTPSMARLAAQGTRFSTFYAQSVCSPTRATLMTGQNATRHATTQWIRPEGNNKGKFGPSDWNWSGLKKADVTLPRILQGEGYRTLFLGKAHFGPLDSEGADPLNLGFDVNIGGAPWGRPKSYLASNHYGNHPKYAKKMTHNVPYLEAYYDSDIFLTEALTLEANKEITKSVEAEEPFFLYMSHYALHSPFESDTRFAANYADSDKPARAQAFATLVEGMDKSLGDIMDHLETLGVAEDTLIFFLGDNGTDAPLGSSHEVGCAAPLKGKKGTHYEGGMRVPFIAAWAKPDAANAWQQQLPIAAGTIQTQLGTIMDLYPTILEVAGAMNPEEYIYDGYGLKTLLTGERDKSHPDAFLMHFPHDHRSKYFTSYRNGDWKLVYHYYPKTNKQQSHYELFNLKDDFAESTNLAKSNPEKLNAMVRAMVAQLEAEEALCPVDAKGNELRPVVPSM